MALQPTAIRQPLRMLSGRCLPTMANAWLFNLHISTAGGEPSVFPSAETGLDEFGRLLFCMSSGFPGHLIPVARDKGYLGVSTESRFFGYKAGYEVIVDFFDIGTRASNLR